ncbi:hypothetical protein [Streptomyces sp. FXJ1.172]|uniref:hypothetical protein n=1 Tax=Streptomyces sp. FXJ1.172 TaxID=710705 RepID=UPI003FA72BAD
MLLDIGQQGAAAADRDVEQPVVVAAVLARREFPVGAHQALAEFLPGLLQRGRRAVGVDTEQRGGSGYRLGLDLGVPQQRLLQPGKCVERAVGQGAVFRYQRLGGAHTAAPGGLSEAGQYGGDAVGAGPVDDRVPHCHEQPGPQRLGGFAEREPAEDLVEGGGGDHVGERPGQGQADDGVLLRRLPVPGHQQRGGPGAFRVGTGPQRAGEQLVRFPGVFARWRIGRTRRVGGGH